MALPIPELITQVRAWQAKGLLAGDVADALILDVQSAHNTSPFLQNKIIKILIALGSVLIGLGILLFIASNWQFLPAGVKTAMIFVGLILFHGVGIVYKRRAPSSFLPGAFHFIATAIFAGGIFLLGQIYHISGDYSNALFWIAVGSLPVAYAVNSRPILSFGLLAGYGWLLRLLFLEDTLSAIYPLVFVLVGLCVYFLGRIQDALGVSRTLTNAYKNLGSITVLVTLFVASFGWFQPYFTDSTIGDGSGAFLTGISFWILIVPGLVFLLSLVLRLRKGEDTREYLYGAALIGCVFLQIIASSGNDSFSLYNSGGTHWVYSLIANISLLVGVGLFFFIGVRDRVVNLVNIAIATIAFTILARYTDYFAAFLPRSIAFIIGGILLLVLGYTLEKKRRQIYQQFGLT